MTIDDVLKLIDKYTEYPQCEYCGMDQTEIFQLRDEILEQLESENEG